MLVRNLVMVTALFLTACGQAIEPPHCENGSILLNNTESYITQYKISVVVPHTLPPAPYTSPNMYIFVNDRKFTYWGDTNAESGDVSMTLEKYGSISWFNNGGETLRLAYRCM